MERAPRRVRVDALELLAFEAGPRARARLAIRCGKGTYVRSLAADLGRALGLPAHLGALRRTAAGSFTLAQATSLDELERLGREDPAALARRALPLAEALGPLPAIRVDAAGERAIRCGQRLGITVPAPLARALAADGRLVALLEPAAGGSRSVRVFAASAAAVPAPGSR